MTKNPSGWSNPPPPETPPPPAPPPQSPMVMQWHTGSREEFQKRAQESSDELYVALFKTLVSYGHGREVPTVAMLTALLDISHDLLINTGQLWAGARLCRRHAQGRRRPGGAAREQFRIVSNRRRLLAANVDRPSAVVFAAAARDRPPPALRSPRRHHDPDRLPARPAGVGAVRLRGTRSSWPAGRLHVGRVKSGTPSVHPMRATNSAPCGACSVTTGHIRTCSSSERGGPMSPKSFHGLFAASDCEPSWPVIPQLRLWLRPGQRRPRHPRAASLSRPQEHPAHRAVHRAGG